MNILVIRTHRLGDVLQLTPMLEGLKKKYPGSTITFLTGTDMKDILSQNPDVGEIITIPEKKYRYYLRERPECYAHVFNEMYDIIGELKKKRFQLIINRQYEVGSVLACLAESQDIRGGTFFPGRGFFFDDGPSQKLFNIIKKDRKANRRNLADWACRIAGVESGCRGMTFNLSEPDRMEADDLLKEGGVCNDDPPVAIQMGAARSFRQWGTENFVPLIRWLVEVMNKSVVLLGTEDEKDQTETVCLSLGTAGNRVIDLTGKTDIKTLGGILERCRCLITGDTGTMHMAAAIGPPVISLFYGTAYPWETGPYGTGHLIIYAHEPCAPCLYPDKCTFGHQCKNDIKPHHVCRAYEIFEAMKTKKPLPCCWPDSIVRLYITEARSGHDQTLLPVNDMNDLMHPFFARSAPVDSGMKDISAYMVNLQNRNNVMMEKFYRGDREGFLNVFAEYVGGWIKLVTYINSQCFNEDIAEIFSRNILPVINEASRALQDEDLVTISDLIRYDFNTIIDKLNCRGATNRPIVTGSSPKMPF